MKILFNDLSKQWKDIEKKVTEKLGDFFCSGMYIDGPYLKEFENSFASYCGRKYAIGVSNGTDGLKLCIQSFELKGNVDVIIPANTYIADILAVEHQPKSTDVNYKVTLIDCDDYYQLDLNLLEQYLENNRSKYDNCILLPVHLYGHPTDMVKLEILAKKYNCLILEDASQAHGSMHNGEMIGKRSNATVYSLYPGKSLGAIGDAGIITTDDETLYNKLKSLRNYGSSKKYYYDYAGYNHRMDPIQAVFLQEKLTYLDKWNHQKNIVAQKYNSLLSGIPEVVTPKTADYVDLHVYHIYCIRVKDRNNLIKYLTEKQIPTVIHYPIPIQLTSPFSVLNKIYNANKNTLTWCDEILSLPMHPYLTDEEINYICKSIKEFYKNV